MSKNNIDNVKQNNEDIEIIDLDLIVNSSNGLKDSLNDIKDTFNSTINENNIHNKEKDDEIIFSTNSKCTDISDDIDHELKVIYKLRILLNECEKLSNKVNNLKLKTNKESSIYSSQIELIESINKNQTSNQKLKEESKGIDSKTSILYLKKLNE